MFGQLKIGKEFYIALFISAICSIFLLFTMHQEDLIGKASAAIRNNENEIAKTYIDKLFRIDMVGTEKETVLMVACESGNAELIEYIIVKGANPNKTVAGKQSPLELFCAHGFKAGNDILLSLLKNGAKQSSYVTQPAIIYLAEQYYWMSEEEKKIATDETITLLQFGAPMGYGNSSLLHYAAKGNMEDLFYTIVHTTEGLNLLTMADGEGNTPWDVSVKYGSSEVQRIIRNLESESMEDDEQYVEEEWIYTDPTAEAIINELEGIVEETVTENQEIIVETTSAVFSN